MKIRVCILLIFAAILSSCYPQRHGYYDNNHQYHYHRDEKRDHHDKHHDKHHDHDDRDENGRGDYRGDDRGDH